MKAAIASSVPRASAGSNVLIGRTISSLPLCKQPFGRLDIPVLGSLAATANQKNELIAIADEIDPVTAAMMNAQLADAIAHGTHNHRHARTKAGPAGKQLHLGHAHPSTVTTICEMSQFASGQA
ncbi:hypothetical protein [Pannonibacter indicus]|uniref:hypothetical protein n=1 Tax=Pannonibacter indicus TaxID=466044 RepID=UPI003CC51DCA